MNTQEPLIIISIDSLHPNYSDLNYNATNWGGPGDYLMPNVREFRDESAYWPNAMSWLPSVTDPNYLNALAGTHSGQTGITSVIRQVTDVSSDGLVYSLVNVDLAKYPNGEPVETIFHLFDEQKDIAFISNKSWVSPAYGTVVDLVSTEQQPKYVVPPDTYNFYDPPTDIDGSTDLESLKQRILANRFLNTHVSDHWVVEETLEVLQQDQPDVVFVLMGSLDAAQHYLGAIDINDLGQPESWEYNRFGELVSRRNYRVYKEPVLDAIRDVDQAFGDLITGINQIDYYDNANIILLSDHNMETFFANQQESLNITTILEDNGLNLTENSIYISGGLLSSVAQLFWEDDNDPTIQQAEDILETYKVINPQTGILETPWYVINQEEMILGSSEDSLPPLALYNQYFDYNLAWPDLIVLAKNGWPIGAREEVVNSRFDFLASHGSFNTQEIMLAVQGLGLPIGTYDEEAFISDIGVSIMDYYNLNPSYPDLVGRNLKNLTKASEENSPDILIGVDPNSTNSGVEEIDTLTRGGVPNYFLLGDATKVYYNDSDPNTIGNSDYALTTDFMTQDVIELKGTVADYVLAENYTLGSMTDTAIFFDDSVDELIGFVQEVVGLNLNGNDFGFVS